WATIAGRQIRFDERAAFVEKLTARGASKACLEQFLATCAAENPNRRLRMIALSDRVSMTVERADFDDLVTLVTQAPTWEKDRMGGVRILLRAIAEGKADAPDQILARWTWRLARASRKVQDRRASSEFPESKRLLVARAGGRAVSGRRARATTRASSSRSSSSSSSTSRAPPPTALQPRKMYPRRSPPQLKRPRPSLVYTR